jgi:hypothetical protein
MGFDAHAFFSRWIAASNQLDFEAMEELLHPDVVVEYPQSGERIHGFAAFKAHLENYPGGLTVDVSQLTDARLVDNGERWAVTPAFTVVPLAHPNRFTTLVRSKYPDNSWWRIVIIVEIRDDKIYRAESYFAPEMPAPLMAAIGQGVPG